MLSASEVKQKYGGLLRSIPKVSSVGCHGGKFCVYVLDEETMNLLKELLVKEVEGVTIVYRVTGKFVAYSDEQNT